MEGHGFDCEFVDAVPDYLRCVVCQFVLREPVQIMKCGHRFCQHCFERIKSHAATQGNQGVCCPIDRDMIDLRNVFQDTGMARVISNLKVRCPNKEAGCTWIGDLLETESHKEGCRYGKPIALQNPSALQTTTLLDSNALNGLHDRMNMLENDGLEKEKDILHLKHNFNELKKQLNLKESQVQDWGTKYDHLENELRVIRSQNEELKKMSEKEIEVLTVRNQFLDYKVSGLEKQLMESKNISDEKMEQKMKGLVLASKHDSENDVHAELIEELRNKINNVTDEIGTLKLKIEDNCNKVDTNEARFDVDHKALDDRLLNLCTKVDELNVGFEKQALKENVNNEYVEDFDDVQHRVMSLENILLNGTDGRPKDRVVVQWKIYDYQNLFDIGKEMHSPIFNTHMKEYSFRLFVKWSGEGKENIGVWFILRRSKECVLTQKLESYNLRHTLQAVGPTGKLKSLTIPEANFNQFKDTSFTIGPSKEEAEMGNGWPAFLTKEQIDDFLIDGTLNIRCILTHPQ